MSSLSKFLDRVRGTTPQPAASQPLAEANTGSIFSTDVVANPRMERSTFVAKIGEMAMRIKPTSMTVHDGGQTMTMDEAIIKDAASGVTTAQDSATFGQSAKAAFALGTAATVPDSILLWYASQGFPGFQTLAIMAQHWLVLKACTIPARDAVRAGWEIRVGDGNDELDADVTKAIRRADKRLKLNQHLVEFIKFRNVFGIRIAMFMVDHEDSKTYYEQPFNIDAVKPGAYRGISQIDPYWCMPEMSMQASSNPTAQDFYKPTWWIINGRRIHSSHLVIILGDEVADVLKPSYQFAGVSLVQKIYERVYASERTANEAPQLAMTKRMRVMTTDIAKAIANEDGMRETMEWRSRNMNNYGTDVIGEKDKIEMFDTSLADLDAVIMTEYQLVAGIAEMPATKLLGTSPKGFNATGEFEQGSYHEMVESLEVNDMQPLIERHYELLMRSEIAPQLLGKTIDIEIEWNPLNSPTSAELADVNLKKAQTAQIYQTAGAIDGADIRDKMISDRDSGYSGLAQIVPDDVVTPATAVPADPAQPTLPGVPDA